MIFPKFFATQKTFLNANIIGNSELALKRLEQLNQKSGETQ